MSKKGKEPEVLEKTSLMVWHTSYKQQMDDRNDLGNVCIGRMRCCWHTLRLRSVLLFLLILAYSFIGGAIFYATEQPYEKEQHENMIAAQTEKLQTMTSDLKDIALKCGNNEIKCEQDIRKVLQKHPTDWNKSVDEINKYNWQSYMNAVWYATTIYTTIGYGNLSPATTAGKILTIIYGLIGIPLMLAFLNELGKKICFGLDALYTKLYHLCKKGDKEKTIRFPVSAAVVIIFLYMLICAAIMKAIESPDGPMRNYFDAVYFFFITLTTVGLGDVMPEDPKNMLAASVLLVIGLALVSTVISMLNARIEDQYFAAMEAMSENLRDDEAEHAFGATFQLARGHFAVGKNKRPKAEGETEPKHEEHDDTHENESPYPAVLGMVQVRPELREHEDNQTETVHVDVENEKDD